MQGHILLLLFIHVNPTMQDKSLHNFFYVFSECVCAELCQCLPQAVTQDWHGLHWGGPLYRQVCVTSMSCSTAQYFRQTIAIHCKTHDVTSHEHIVCTPSESLHTCDFGSHTFALWCNPCVIMAIENVLYALSVRTRSEEICVWASKETYHFRAMLTKSTASKLIIFGHK